LVFDGTHMWVSNGYDGSLWKLRPSDEALIGTYTGPVPGRLAFDGTHIWVTNSYGGTVTQLLPSDDDLVEVVATHSLGAVPSFLDPGYAYVSSITDGTHIWFAWSLGSTVSKLRVSDGALVGMYSVGKGPSYLLFADAHIWVASTIDNTVSKLRPSDGVLVGTYPVHSPNSLVFDGTHIWVAASNTASPGNGFVSRLRASDGALVSTYETRSRSPVYMVFDGTHVWVTNWDSIVSRFRASDGALVTEYPVGNAARFIAFDGTHIWVNSRDTHFEYGLSKILASGECADTKAVPEAATGVLFATGQDADQTSYLDVSWNSAERADSYRVELWRSVDSGTNYVKFSEAVVSGLSHRFTLSDPPAPASETRYQVVVYGRGYSELDGTPATVSGIAAP
jgi:hypothetical protein